MKYRMNIAGLDRDLPLCKVSDDLYIGAFVMFGDAEITVACARELLARAPHPPHPRDGSPVRRKGIFRRPQGSEGLYAPPAACDGPFHHDPA